MLVIGAKGHAKELLDILEKNNMSESLFFFDDTGVNIETDLYGKYPILRSIEEVKRWDASNKIFALGIGNPKVRFRMTNLFKNLGWQLTSVIANDAQIGNHNVQLGDGVNVMHRVFISNDVMIGEGTLINAGVLIHHNVSIGKFCEISPGVCLTGGIKVGDFSFIGAHSVITPKVNIGAYSIVGAGSVVIRDIPPHTTAVGVPASVIKIANPHDAL
jgi:sugar O-acyltransferase (sialic acid O-acetyltransferase NeuD family)